MGKFVVWWCCAFLLLPCAPALDTRCEPYTSEKVLCFCIDWTGRQECSPRVAVRTQNECVAAGGEWGRNVAGQQNILYAPLLLPSIGCGGDWQRKKTRDEAENVYDAVIQVRDSVNTQQQPLTALHITGAPIAAVSPFAAFSMVPQQQVDVQLATTGVRSIVVTPSFGPTSGGVWVQLVGAGSYHTPNSLQCKLDLVEQFCYSNHYMYSWCYITPKCPGVFPFRCHNGPLKFEGKYAVIAKIPWVTSVYPYSGDTRGGAAVSVRGWNFEPHCPSRLLCRFGSTIVPAKFYTSSSVICIAPCTTQKGFVSVEVSNDGGEHWSMSGVQFGFVGDELTTDEMKKEGCSRYIWTDSPRAVEQTN
eukprot:c1790_g1_i1.p1 GENE.c1790_g1_i1~~c1790_g1_i1.p1  ORF type:complete len:360 (+),score=55.39 c1790_g1_i1:53-1132(+)